MFLYFLIMNVNKFSFYASLQRDNSYCVMFKDKTFMYLMIR